MLKILKRLRKDAPRRFKDLQIACDELIGSGGPYYTIYTSFINFNLCSPNIQSR